MSRVPHAVVAALMLAGVAAAPGAALAKAPAGGKSAEDLIVLARKAAAEKALAEQEKKRDRTKEMIDAYRDGKSALGEWQPLADIVNNGAEAPVQPYRPMAAEALLKRFESANADSDPAVRAVRREVAMAIVDLMKASAKDELGLRIVDQLLGTWYRQKMVQEIRFKTTDKQKERESDCKKMKDFLKKEKD
ncbi:MAG: hypothetical protein HMLKMBBP_01354 [Planctomycetes bacterium]|nr:hypothetical protein [Planctomycetota bacterium]